MAIIDSKELMKNALKDLENSQESPKKSSCHSFECKKEWETKPEDWYRNPYGQWQCREGFCPTCREEFQIRENEKKRIEAEEKAKWLVDAPAARLCKVPAILRTIFPRKFANVEYILPESFQPYIFPAERGLCLTGKPGVGKTMIMAMIVRDHFKQASANPKWGSSHWEHFGLPGKFNSPWKFLCYPEFIMELQDRYRKESEESVLDLIKKISEWQYLIIDDLGAEKPTDFVKQATYLIINHREMHEKATFITTNFSLDFLDENIDSRIASRICGMCDIKQITSDDKRKLTRRN